VVIKRKLVKENCSIKQKNSFVYRYIDHTYSEFKEADIKFAPTYKFDLRSDDDIYAKHRTPSYTVRIESDRIFQLKLNKR
jgi:hypothetical protein